MSYTAEQDPLCYPGSNVLINLADILDQETLDQFELSMFLIRAEEQWPTGRITADYYLRLHHHLFQDVYTWAGELRNIRIGKGGNWFCYPEHIERELERIYLSGCDRSMISPERHRRISPATARTCWLN